ncbi:protein BTN1 [Protomyces lactucae-debilis]|uniref:Protein BTN n=1 Tax=Protomyces lactucae-debilis TaxID=2754530 RepID=A0A1Y2F2L4_PROLT|nr:protein BTN1 [Protomyces lactucae-debilis]ORY77724.1 protein BTN1 [Protomyces lactucae-debilis]
MLDRWQRNLAQLPKRVLAAFFLLGVINNVLYVIILSAALDLVGAKTPKAIVLLANILPSVLVKLVAPYIFEHIPHRFRVIGVVLTNIAGMLIVGTGASLAPRMVGIAMASAASGAGEITFLQLSTHYPPIALAAWSSGTGGAGILGGVLYVACTTWLRISPSWTLLMASLLPLIMALSFFVLLPARESVKYAVLEPQPEEESQELVSGENERSAKVSGILQKMKSARPLLIPYMAPLFLVYFAEYTINQGVSPTLLFPIKEMPFERYRDVYPTYATLYQIGVFISRSSSPFIRIRRLYIPSLFQCGLLAICITQSIRYFLPNIYPIFLLIFIEGLAGGAVYVNTFVSVSEDPSIQESEREFSMGVIGVADSFGILCAAGLSLWLEGRLCEANIARGRPYCSLE